MRPVLERWTRPRNELCRGVLPCLGTAVGPHGDTEPTECYETFETLSRPKKNCSSCAWFWAHSRRLLIWMGWRRGIRSGRQTTYWRSSVRVRWTVRSDTFKLGYSSLSLVAISVAVIVLLFFIGNGGKNLWPFRTGKWGKATSFLKLFHKVMYCRLVIRIISAGS